MDYENDKLRMKTKINTWLIKFGLRSTCKFLLMHKRWIEIMEILKGHGFESFDIKNIDKLPERVPCQKKICNDCISINFCKEYYNKNNMEYIKKSLDESIRQMMIITNSDPDTDIFKMLWKDADILRDMRLKYNNKNI